MSMFNYRTNTLPCLSDVDGLAKYLQHDALHTLVACHPSAAFIRDASGQTWCCEVLAVACDTAFDLHTVTCVG